MVHLERTLIFYLNEPMNPWKRYVDDTISVIKEASIAHILTVLYNFHIELTYEVKKNGKRAFLDIFVITNNNTLEATVYRKKKHNGVYLHWKSFAPIFGNIANCVQ